MGLGGNESGQLGNGTTDMLPTPAPLTELENDVVALSASASNSVALRADGTLWSWGSNVFWQIGDGVSTQQPFPTPVLHPCRFTGMPSRDHRAPGTSVCHEAR